ncbi:MULTISPECIES: hypothetical protein [unclassified Vibrio]|uniref:hypothetical protein n=1 Tax=unclassified Vibrio TaxID=2614977 RepID=UPI0011103144|nr:hypothetical protein [Vibrio sp. Hep-1b-8]TMX35882.1 hypothetical protein DA100_13660 [Vibrio sp. Hep-1b-8]
MLTHYSPIAFEKTPLIDERDLFIASNVQSLEDFLKTELSGGRHIYCSFSQSHLDWSVIRNIKHREIKSIGFVDGQTLVRR